MMMQNPRVSVLMPVFNGQRHLREAIESILAQTFGDFEFLIINDGSTDESVRIIESFKDPRIRIEHNESNLGVVASLNTGLQLAKGVYIARMDCDDISKPDRLTKQVAFMDRNTQVGISGAWVQTFGPNAHSDIWAFPADPSVIKCRLLFESVLAHPSVIMRKELLDRHDLRYDPKYLHAEDFQLWQRASHLFPIMNIPDVLVMYRISSDSVSRSNRKSQLQTLANIDRECLKKIGINASPSELSLHRKLALYQFEPSLDFLNGTEEWFKKIIEANDRSNVYSKYALKQVLSDKWVQACHVACQKRLLTLNRFHYSAITNKFKAAVIQKLRIVSRCRSLISNLFNRNGC